LNFKILCSSHRNNICNFPNTIIKCRKESVAVIFIINKGKDSLGW
jgi:hypothetical protein